MGYDEYNALRGTYKDVYKVTRDDVEQTYKVEPASSSYLWGFNPKNEKEMEEMVNDIYCQGVCKGIYENMQNLPNSTYNVDYWQDERGQTRGFYVERPDDFVRFFIDTTRYKHMAEDIIFTLDCVYKRGYMSGVQDIFNGFYLPIKDILNKIRVDDKISIEDVLKLLDDIKKPLKNVIRSIDLDNKDLHIF